jgi:hypothetical protein
MITKMIEVNTTLLGLAQYIIQRPAFRNVFKVSNLLTFMCCFAHSSRTIFAMGPIQYVNTAMDRGGEANQETVFSR